VDDRAVVARQLGREPRTLRRVVVRCPWGLPAVTEQDPYGPDGERLEAAGGVERWSGAIAGDTALRDDLDRATGEQRRLRRELAAGRTGSDRGASLGLGIGGSRNPAALKCLHAHVAFALACPGYRLGEAILDEIPERWPERCCSTV
jgi:hypothetical protein